MTRQSVLSQKTMTRGIPSHPLLALRSIAFLRLQLATVVTVAIGCLLHTRKPGSGGFA